MRIAVLSDIHGNPFALDGVLDDIVRAGGVDQYWLLGDYAAIGPDPAGVLARLERLTSAQFTRGNTDRYTVDGVPGLPDAEKIVSNPVLLPTALEIHASFAWTRGAVTAVGKLDWLVNLPLELRVTLPDGTRFLGVHAAPGTDDGTGISSQTTETELAALVRDVDADLIMVGHTHQPREERVAGKHVVNLGSVSNPVTEDPRAKYVILHADGAGYRVEPRRVDYDREAVITCATRVRYPDVTRLTKFMRGGMIRR